MEKLAPPTTELEGAHSAVNSIGDGMDESFTVGIDNIRKGDSGFIFGLAEEETFNDEFFDKILGKFVAGDRGLDGGKT